MALTEAQATARAEAAVRAYCGWHVAPETDALLTLDGPGSPVLLLPSLHVTAVASVAENGELVDPADYSWSASGVVRRSRSALTIATWSGSGWTDALRGVTVAFTHGYQEWPLEVQAVVERLAARALEGATVLTQVGSVSYATGEDGLPIGGTLSSVDRAVLDRYKLPPRP